MLEAEKVLLEGVKSADPPTSSGISFTKKSRQALEAFLVAIGKLFVLQSLRKSRKFCSNLAGMSPLILLSSSSESLGYLSL